MELVRKLQLRNCFYGNPDDRRTKVQRTLLHSLSTSTMEMRLVFTIIAFSSVFTVVVNASIGTRQTLAGTFFPT
jgi:hypothetical protein